MTQAIINLARPEIVAMQAYSSARSEQTVGKVWLDANENPWDNNEDERYNRYPDPQPASIINRVAEIYGVSSDQVLVSRGSDEAIDLLTRVFCQAGEDHIQGLVGVGLRLQGRSFCRCFTRAFRCLDFRNLG